MHNNEGILCYMLGTAADPRGLGSPRLLDLQQRRILKTEGEESEAERVKYVHRVWVGEMRLCHHGASCVSAVLFCRDMQWLN